MKTENKKHLFLVKLTQTQASIPQQLQALGPGTGCPLKATPVELRAHSQAQHPLRMTQPVIISKQKCSLSQSDFHFSPAPYHHSKNDPKDF